MAHHDCGNDPLWTQQIASCFFADALKCCAVSKDPCPSVTCLSTAPSASASVESHSNVVCSAEANQTMPGADDWKPCCMHAMCAQPLPACRWPSETLKRCYSLCQHMMHFFHQYLLYVTFEVLEPLWHTMSAQCRTATTLDQVPPPPPAPPCPNEQSQ